LGDILSTIRDFIIVYSHNILFSRLPPVVVFL